MCSVYSEQKVYGRTEKCDDVEDGLGQTFIENLRSHEINDKAKHLYKRKGIKGNKESTMK